MSNRNKPFVPVTEAAHRHGISRKAAYRAMEKGLIPTGPDGKIPRSDFEQSIAAMCAPLILDEKESA